MADINEPHDDDVHRADVHQLPCVPDPEAMRAHLRIFQYAVRGKIELAWTTLAPGTKERVKLNNAQLFDVDDDSIESLIAYACELGALPNVNTYIGVALRNEDAAIMGRHGAKDCLAIPALKADCDAPGCLTRTLNICEEIKMRPNRVVFTGRTPHLRGAPYWELDEPVGPAEFERVERIERAMVKLFGSDPAVVDCSRVMRLGGGVAWPIKQGRVLEPTGMYRSQHGERPTPFSLEEIEHWMAKATANSGSTHTSTSKADAGASGASPSGAFDFNDAKQAFDFDALLAEAKRDGHWHNAALKLIAHYWNLHTPDDAIIDLLAPLLRQDGYSLSDTRAQIATMIRTAARKWTRPQRKPEEPQMPPPPGGDKPGDEAKPEPPHGDPAHDEFPMLFISELRDKQPSFKWRIQHLMPMVGLGIGYSRSGAGKSFLMLDLGLRMTHGIEWMGKKLVACPVVYVAAEDAHGMRLRAHGWLNTRGEDLTEEQRANAHFALLTAPINMRDPNAVYRLAMRLVELEQQGKMPRPGLIVIDTMARCFGDGDEKDSKDMNLFIAACDKLAQYFSCFVLVVHHEGKDATKGERGSSTLPAAEDMRLYIARDGNEMAATITVEKVKNAETGMSYRVDFKRIVIGVDEETGDEITTLIPVWDGEERRGAGPKAGSESSSTRAQHGVAYALRDGPLSHSEIMLKARLPERSVTRALKWLREQGRVRRADSGRWELVIDDAV